MKRQYSGDNSMTYYRKCRDRRLVVKLLVFAVTFLLVVWSFRHALLHDLRFVSSSQYRQCVLRRRNYALEEKTSPLYLTIANHGRFGNWMFAYASLLAIAKANGYIPYIEHSHPLTNYFPLTHTRPSKAECLLSVPEDKPCTYQPEMMNLPAGNISIDGYLQSWKYFQIQASELRNEFQLHPFLALSARNLFKVLVGQYLQLGFTVISIHVRRGDYLKPEAQKIGFAPAPTEYFNNAMLYMGKKFPRSVFLVISDDIPWCKENLTPPTRENLVSDGRHHHQRGERSNFDTDEDRNKRDIGGGKRLERMPIVFSNGASVSDDFGMLTMCNHSILSYSSMGWWGAWLARGHVTYYSGLPLPGTKVDLETKREDFYPKDWVGLSRAGHSCCLLPWLVTLSCLIHVVHFLV